jgi:hypothetical protein
MMFKPLNDYTDDELIEIIQKNQEIELLLLAGICSEILRRMNERKLLLTTNHQDWGNPLTP